jgi:hypothetical protein
MQNVVMRTTITLSDDTHEFASYYARCRGLSLSAAIQELIQKVQRGPEPEVKLERGPNGLPMFPPSGRRITSEMVKQLEAEEYEPKNFVGRKRLDRAS